MNRLSGNDSSRFWRGKAAVSIAIFINASFCFRVLGFDLPLQFSSILLLFDYLAYDITGLRKFSQLSHSDRCDKDPRKPSQSQGSSNGAPPTPSKRDNWYLQRNIVQNIIE
jgi:hypothetical protein